MTHFDGFNGELDGLVALAEQANSSIGSYLRGLCEFLLEDLGVRLRRTQDANVVTRQAGIHLRYYLREHDAEARRRRLRSLKDEQQRSVTDLDRYISALRERYLGMPPSLLYYFISELRGIKSVPPGGVPQEISVGVCPRVGES